MNKDIIILVLVFIILTVSSIAVYNHYTSPEFEDKYNELYKEHQLLNDRYDSLRTNYIDVVNESDSIIEYYTHKLDSTITENDNIKQDYEDKLKDINDITIVSNDSVTEYISSRIHN